MNAYVSHVLYLYFLTKFIIYVVVSLLLGYRMTPECSLYSKDRVRSVHCSMINLLAFPFPVAAALMTSDNMK